MADGTGTTPHGLRWGAPTFESQAAPEQAVDLLSKALALAPDNPRLLARLAAVQLDRYDFAGAVASYEALRRVAPGDAAVRVRLAACLNELGRSAEALQNLEPSDAPGLQEPEALYQCATALIGLGRLEAAESELRALLAAAPGHRNGCGALMRLLRKAGRGREALAACEALAAQGVGHAQLLLDWGLALAACGERRGAGALMFDPARLGRMPLPAPPPFAETTEFCAALSDALARHPLVLSKLGGRDANRGSRRVHQLLGGRRRDLVRALAATLQDEIDSFVANLPARDMADPWLAARPRRARLSCWGLIQRPGEFEDWHSHPAGWLSGVCYLRLPTHFSTQGEGDGCIEFGAPPGLGDVGLSPCATLRLAPHEGLLLLAPSHYLHRTIPFAAPGERISFAFDVVPDDA